MTNPTIKVKLTKIWLKFEDSLSDLVNKESDGELDHETTEMFKKIKEHKEAEQEQKQDEQFKEFDA